jgi:hypothetical protein
MVIHDQFKPTHCTRCRKEFGTHTEQYETPFSENTDAGGDWVPPPEEE